MQAHKSHDYLGANDSEEDDVRDDVADAQDSRTAGLSQHRPKRRKLSSSGAEDESDSFSQAYESDGQHSITKIAIAPERLSPSNALRNAPHASSTSPRPVDSEDPKRLGLKKRKSKPGVIYLSRIPPFMKPAAVRNLLSPYGSISQIFLTPEPPAAYAARKRHGGNKKRSFIDGWVEFNHKRHAKACVDGINGQIVGGKKGGWYRDDVWNAKYLRGFSWDDLMAGVRQEEREREERVRVGIAKDKREREMFLNSLEAAKVEETRERKRVKRLTGADDGHDASEHTKDLAQKEIGRGPIGAERTFRQKDVQGRSTKKNGQPDEVTRVLSKIF